MAGLLHGFAPQCIFIQPLGIQAWLWPPWILLDCHGPDILSTSGHTEDASTELELLAATGHFFEPRGVGENMLLRTSVCPANKGWSLHRHGPTGQNKTAPWRVCLGLQNTVPGLLGIRLVLLATWHTTRTSS